MAVKKPVPAPKEDPQQYVLRKNYKKAIEIYRSMVKDTPDDASLGLRLADCLILDSQVAAAVHEYKRVAQLYAEQGFLLKAIGVNKKVVKLDPSQKDVHQSLSKLYEERGLLAKPETAGSSGRPAEVGGSDIDIGMEASDGMELDIKLGGHAAASPAPPAPEPELDLAAADLAPADDLAPAADPATAIEPDALPEELSLDALGDALGQEVTAAVAPAETAPEPTGSGLGFDFGLGAPAAAPPAPAAADTSGLGGFDFGLGSPSPSPAPEVSDSVLSELGSDILHEQSPLSLHDESPLSLHEEAPLSPAAAAPGQPALTKTPLFSDFTPDEFVQVVTELTEETYPKDAVIVREGDPGDSLFVLVSGSIRVMTQLKGKDLQLAVMKEGEFFGEGALITGGPRTATIIANEDSQLLCLSKPALDRIVAAHPRVMEVMKQFYEQRAEDTVDVILRSGKK